MLHNKPKIYRSIKLKLGWASYLTSLSLRLHGSDTHLPSLEIHFQKLPGTMAHTYSLPQVQCQTCSKQCLMSMVQCYLSGNIVVKKDKNIPSRTVLMKQVHFGERWVVAREALTGPPPRQPQFKSCCSSAIISSTNLNLKCAPVWIVHSIVNYIWLPNGLTAAYTPFSLPKASIIHE